MLLWYFSGIAGLQVTLIAPWIPPSSRPGTGSWLSSLTLWVPVPLLQAVVGFINNRIVQQVITAAAMGNQMSCLISVAARS
jgi:hypothetical protein